MAKTRPEMGDLSPDWQRYIRELRQGNARWRKENQDLRGALDAQAERDNAAAAKCGRVPMGCDTSDDLADAVLGLRAKLAEAEKVGSKLVGDLIKAEGGRTAAIYAQGELRAKIAACQRSIALTFAEAEDFRNLGNRRAEECMAIKAVLDANGVDTASGLLWAVGMLAKAAKPKE